MGGAAASAMRGRSSPMALQSGACERVRCSAAEAAARRAARHRSCGDTEHRAPRWRCATLFTAPSAASPPLPASSAAHPPLRCSWSPLALPSHAPLHPSLTLLPPLVADNGVSLAKPGCRTPPLLRRAALRRRRSGASRDGQARPVGVHRCRLDPTGEAAEAGQRWAGHRAPHRLQHPQLHPSAIARGGPAEAAWWRRHGLRGARRRSRHRLCWTLQPGSVVSVYHSHSLPHSLTHSPAHRMRQHPPSSSSSSSSSSSTPIHPSILLTVSPPPLALACARRVRCGVERCRAVQATSASWCRRCTTCRCSTSCASRAASAAATAIASRGACGRCSPTWTTTAARWVCPPCL